MKKFVPSLVLLAMILCARAVPFPPPPPGLDHPPSRACSPPPAAKKNCGFYGITEEKCRNAHDPPCCFRQPSPSEGKGTPWCYYPSTTPAPPKPGPTPAPKPHPTPAPKPHPTPPPQPHGETQTTKDLNAAINGSVYPAVYTNGKGIILRNPFDGFEYDGNKKVVPSTFWVNDIFTPSQVYAGSGGGDGNPWCPSTTAYCPKDPDTGDWGPYNSIQMAYVINKHMDKLFYDWNNIQKSTWGNGVFYPTDSNSADLRCAFFSDKNGYDCAGGWIDAGTGGFGPDSSKKGAGWYRGAGCHFNHHDAIDQTDARVGNNNLVGTHECECDYSFKKDWTKWVDQWTEVSYLSKQGGKGPSWAADLASCWLNNPRDMINLQNAIYWKRYQWNDQKTPYVVYQQNNSQANRPYWGWNEVPVDRATITNPAYWDAVMIKLPAAVCGGTGSNDLLSCVPSQYQVQFEKTLELWSGKGYLNHEIVIVREFMDENTNYFRDFFCESWTSPSGKYKLIYDGQHCKFHQNTEIVV